MTAFELNQQLNHLIPVLPERTVDRVIYGDPRVQVKGIAVAWMPYRETIVEAARRGANVLVVHEPTFYDHWDLQGDFQSDEQTEAKKQLIDSLGVTIVRCHDVWDVVPDMGIPFAWGAFLELGRPVTVDRYYHMCEVPEQTALAFARHVASKTAELGQPSAGFYGDPDRVVRKIGIGTSCGSDPFALYALGADLAIAVDDIVRAWVAGEWCRDSGRPLVVVNHGVSEEPGMAALAGYLAATFPGLPVTHIRQRCSFVSVGAAG